MGDIGDLVQLMNLKKSMDEQDRGQPLPGDLAWKLAAQDEAMNKLKMLIQLKTKGFGGQGIDTGPLAGRVPENVSAWASEKEGLPPEDQGDRGRLNQETLWFTNPIRKEVTGAQAAVQELKKFIQPMVPQPTDNDNVWLSKAMGTGENLGQERQSLIKELMNQGLRAPQFDYDAYMSDIKNKLYGK